MDNLYNLIWDHGTPEISHKGFRAYPIHDHYVVLYSDPDADTHYAGIPVKRNVIYVSVEQSLGAAADCITNEAS